MTESVSCPLTYLCPVSGPGDLVDAARGRLLQGVRPANLVAQSQRVEGSDREHLIQFGCIIWALVSKLLVPTCPSADHETAVTG